MPVVRLCREIKEEKVADLERKKEITKQRREREAEKLRLEQMAARVRPASPLPARARTSCTFADLLLSLLQMSAKKLQRMKKRLGRSKKVAG